MDKQLWKTVETLFHDALLLPANERLNFVRTAAAGNSHLRFEVLTLLKSHETESGFLDQNDSPTRSETLKKLAGELNLQKPGKPDLPDSRTRARQLDSRLALQIEAARPDFVVKSLINRGGMGTVLRVHQRKLNRDVAVKVISVADVDAIMLRRFLRESRATAQIKNDHVVHIYEVGNDPDLPFLVMELVDGPSLGRFIELELQIRPRIAAELARQIALGLAAAHEQNLIHRDIKPANILLEPIKPESFGDQPNDQIGYRAKIIDFGLARHIDHRSAETQDLLFAGTLYYMSPEQFLRPDSVDHRSDIYSLGVTLYQMLTGDRPFHGAPHMVMRMIELADPTPLRKLDDRIPKDLESICLKALSKDPLRRYQSAEAFSADLTRFLNGQPTDARPVSRIEKMSRWVARNQRVSLFAGLAACLLMLLSVGSLIFAMTVQSKDSMISRQVRQITNQDRMIEQQMAKSVETQVKRILDADAGALPFAIEDLDSRSKPIRNRLATEFGLPANDLNRRFNAAVALSRLGSDQTAFIVEHLDRLFISPSIFTNVYQAIGKNDDAPAMLRESLNRTSDPVQGAQRIILLAYLGDFEPWIAAATNREDLTQCTEIIHTFPRWHGELIEFSKSLTAAENADLDWTFCHGLALLDRRSLNQEAFETLTNFLRIRSSRTDDYVVYTSAQRLLASWDQPLPDRKTGFGNAWYQLENGIRMIKIQPATSTMGQLEQIKIDNGYPPHEVTISRPFYMADCEISVRQYHEFLRDPDCADADKPDLTEGWQHSTIVSPTDDHPIQNVSWHDAVLFCNWLSHREGLQPVYEKLSPPPVESKPGDKVETQDWTWNENTNGYRLPHEHEFELACRAGSKTPYFFGTRREYFPDYGLASNHTRLPAGPVRSRLPNRFGMYDMHGNLWEWCNDWYSYLDETPLNDPHGPSQPVGFGRTIRSGGVGTRSGETDSESRGWQHPDVRFDNLGFRIARNAD